MKNRKLNQAELLGDALDRITVLEGKLRQVDKQSRCKHVWEPDEEDAHIWRCANCDAVDLKRH